MMLCIMCSYQFIYLSSHDSDLAIALSDACLLYFENAHIMYKAIEYTEKGVANKIVNNITRSRIIMSKFTALESLAITNAERRLEACQVGEEIILLFDQNREWNKNDPYCQGRGVNVSISMEIDTCQYLARLYSYVRTQENDGKNIKYLQRAISVCKEIGKDEQAKQLEQIHEMQRAKFSRKHEGIREEKEFAQAEANLPNARESYNTVVSNNGGNCAAAVTCGKNLAMVLLQSG